MLHLAIPLAAALVSDFIPPARRASLLVLLHFFYEVRGRFKGLGGAPSRGVLRFSPFHVHFESCISSFCNKLQTF